MSVDKGSVDTNDNKEEEERGGGGLRKRSEEEEEMEEEDMLMTKLDLPPERQERQKLMNNSICLANHTNRKGCFFVAKSCL